MQNTKFKTEIQSYTLVPREEGGFSVYRDEIMRGPQGFELPYSDYCGETKELNYE